MCLTSQWQVRSPERLDPRLLNGRTFDARADFNPLFELLLEASALGNTDDRGHRVQENRLSSELQVLANAHKDKLYALKRDEKYSRHIIGTSGEWIGYICRWEPNVTSEIHGHPSFAYYQVLDGEFGMDLYEPIDKDAAQLDYSLRMTTGNIIWRQGPSGRYDNMVHSVSTFNSPGFTLHLFSEDPCRGKHFRC